MIILISTALDSKAYSYVLSITAPSHGQHSRELNDVAPENEHKLSILAYVSSGFVHG